MFKDTQLRSDHQTSVTLHSAKTAVTPPLTKEDEGEGDHGQKLCMAAHAFPARRRPRQD